MTVRLPSTLMTERFGGVREVLTILDPTPADDATVARIGDLRKELEVT